MDTHRPASLLQQAIDTFELGEVFPLLVAIVMMLVVANHAVRKEQPSYAWGKRAAFAAFLLWLIRELMLRGFADAAQFATAVFRGLVVAAFTLSASWLLLPVFEFCWSRSVVPVRRKLAAYSNSIRQRRENRLSEQRRRQDQLLAERRDAELEPRRKQEREAAEERERLRREEHLLRENARFECQVLYDRHRSELARRFPETQLQAYFASYMADNRPAEEVTRRAELLKTLIRESVDEPRSKLGKRFESIADIAACFGEKKSRILATDYDSDTKDTLIRGIEREETLVLLEFLKR